MSEALLDERSGHAKAVPRTVPRFHNEVLQCVSDAQGKRVIRTDADPQAIADFALDGIAVAYAVNFRNPATGATGSLLVLDGLHQRK
jgi:hypothetical protein